MFQRYRPQLVVFLTWSNQTSFYFRSFHNSMRNTISIQPYNPKAEHICCARLGFEPWATGWQAQTDSLERDRQTQNILA